jgi:membrane protease YdiL (CAAX protease family)
LFSVFVFSVRVVISPERTSFDYVAPDTVRQLVGLVVGDEETPPIWLAWDFILFLVLGPINVEFVFRTILFDRLAVLMPYWIVVPLSGFLSDFFHMPLGYTTCAGIVMAALYYRFRRIWLAVVAHAAIVILTDLVMPVCATFVDREKEMFVMLMGLGFASCILIFLLFFLLFRQMRAIDNKSMPAK